MDSSEKWHWFSFTFMKGTETGSAFGSTITSYSDRNVTVARIRAAKKQMDFGDQAVVISVCYLGHMTEEEFNREDMGEDPASHPENDQS